MKKYNLLLCLAFANFISACKDKEPADPRKDWFDDSQWAAFQKMDFGCSGIYSNYFVQADLDGQPFCINAEGGDTCYTAISQVVITGANGALSGGFKYRFYVGDKECYASGIRRYTNQEVVEKGELENEVEFEITYQTSQKYPLYFIIDSLFQTGREYPINQAQIIESDPDGRFLLSLNCYYNIRYDPNGLPGNGFIFKTAGRQPDKAFIRLASMKKQEFPDYYIYDLRFEFPAEIDLNLVASHGMKMKNGIMNGTFKVVK